MKPVHGRELIYHEAEQGSDEWLASRIGKLTGTDAHFLWVKPSKEEQTSGIKFAEGAQTLSLKIIGERTTGKSCDGTLAWDRSPYNTAPEDCPSRYYRKNPETGAMKWGKDHENASRILFNAQMNLNFEPVGFIEVKDMGVGCSLDGIDFDSEAIQEMKHYETHKVLAAILDSSSFFMKKVYGVLTPTKEGAQCIHNCYVSGAKTAYLTFRDPRLPMAMGERFAFFESGGDKLQELVAQYADKVRDFMYYVQETELKILGLD